MGSSIRVVIGSCATTTRMNRATARATTNQEDFHGYILVEGEGIGSLSQIVVIRGPCGRGCYRHGQTWCVGKAGSHGGGDRSIIRGGQDSGGC